MKWSSRICSALYLKQFTFGKMKGLKKCSKIHFFTYLRTSVKYSCLGDQSFSWTFSTNFFFLYFAKITFFFICETSDNTNLEMTFPQTYALEAFCCWDWGHYSNWYSQFYFLSNSCSFGSFLFIYLFVRSFNHRSGMAKRSALSLVILRIQVQIYQRTIL